MKNYLLFIFAFILVLSNAKLSFAQSAQKCSAALKALQPSITIQTIAAAGKDGKKYKLSSREKNDSASNENKIKKLEIEVLSRSDSRTDSRISIENEIKSPLILRFHSDGSSLWHKEFAIPRALDLSKSRMKLERLRFLGRHSRSLRQTSLSIQENQIIFTETDISRHRHHTPRWARVRQKMPTITQVKMAYTSDGSVISINAIEVVISEPNYERVRARGGRSIGEFSSYSDDVKVDAILAQPIYLGVENSK